MCRLKCSLTVFMTILGFIFLFTEVKDPATGGIIEIGSVEREVGAINSVADDPVNSEQGLRKNTLGDACLRHNESFPKTSELPKPGAFEHFLADDKHKVIYCWIPKVACTNWKLALVKLIGALSEKELTEIHEHFSRQQKAAFKSKYGLNLSMSQRQGDFLHSPELYRRAGLKELRYMSRKDIKHRLDTYYKFIFVRDPFTRLLSAWKDKFLREDISGTRRRFGPKIINKYRPRTENIQKTVKGNKTSGLKALEPEDYEVTFEEFLRYVGDGNFGNWHWTPQYKQGSACSVQYDFIGKYETLQQDIQQVLNHLVNDTDLQSRLFPPASHGPSHAHTHAQNEADPWADIPEDVVDKIRTVYALDFQLFGYDPHRITGKRHR